MSEEKQPSKWGEFKGVVAKYHSLNDIPYSYQSEYEYAELKSLREVVLEEGPDKITSYITRPLREYFKELKLEGGHDPTYGFFYKQKELLDSLDFKPGGGSLYDPGYLLTEAERLDELSLIVSEIRNEVEPAVKSMLNRMELVQRQVRACLAISKEQAATALSTLFIPGEIYSFIDSGEIIISKCEMFSQVIKSRRQTVASAVSLFPYTRDKWDELNSKLYEAEKSVEVREKLKVR